jgi:hypothetical protein
MESGDMRGAVVSYCAAVNQLLLKENGNIINGKQSHHRTGLDWALGFQYVEAPKISRHTAHECVSLSAPRTSRLYPHQEIDPPVRVEPTTIGRPEQLSQ